MNIYIGQNIKKFRTKNNVTQEKLADYLSVSYQAVSKWERSEASPDITMLPALARFFNTTTDELLGVDNDKYEAEIKAYIAEHSRLNQNGFGSEARELSLKMYAKFPNDFRVNRQYMWDLFYDPNYDYDNHHNLPDWRTIHSDEIILLGEKILSDCIDDQIRFSAIQLLIMVYTGLKEYDTAVEYAKRFPEPDEKIGAVLGEKDPEIGIYYQQKIFSDLLEKLFGMVIFFPYMINDAKKSIKMFDVLANFYIGLFGDEENNVGRHQNWNVAEFYKYIAEQHLLLGEHDEAIENIETAAKYYLFCDAEDYQHTSPLTDRLQLNYTDNVRWVGWQGRLGDYQANYLSTEEKYSPLKTDKRFKDVIQKLKG